MRQKITAECLYLHTYIYTCKDVCACVSVCVVDGYANIVRFAMWACWLMYVAACVWVFCDQYSVVVHKKVLLLLQIFLHCNYCSSVHSICIFAAATILTAYYCCWYCCCCCCCCKYCIARHNEVFARKFAKPRRLIVQQQSKQKLWYTSIHIYSHLRIFKYINIHMYIYIRNRRQQL